jgi:hypothetical protein
MGTNIVNVATPLPATMHARVVEASSSYVEVTPQYLDAVERSAVQQGVPSPGTAPMSGVSCGMSCAQLCFSCGQLCLGMSCSQLCFACGQLCFACGQLCWGMSCGQLCFSCGQLCWGMSCGQQGFAGGQSCPGCGCRCSRCGAQDADQAVATGEAGAEAGQAAPPAHPHPQVGVVAGAGPAPGAEA